MNFKNNFFNFDKPVLKLKTKNNLTFSFSSYANHRMSTFATIK